MRRNFIPFLLLMLVFHFLCFAGCGGDDEDCSASRCDQLTGGEGDDDVDAGGPDDDDDDAADDDAVDPQVEITQPTPLLHADGALRAQGWARSPLMQYNPQSIPEALHWRIKEWDHYTIVSHDFAFTLTIADIQYLTLFSFELIDFADQTMTSGVDISIGSHGFFPLSPNEGATTYRRGSNVAAIEYDQGVRTISAHLDKSLLSVELDLEMIVNQNPLDDDLAAAAPFSDDKRYFFYENKILGMPTSGQAVIDGKTYDFNPDITFAVLDWGRGVWPHTHEWYWGSAAAYHEGSVLGFNIGAGWSHDELGTANVQKVHGIIHKLYYVDFDWDPNDPMKPWRAVSDDGRFDVTLTPVYHQKTGMIILDIGMLLDKVYGTFDGKMTLDNGTVVTFGDLYGFIEHSVQKW